jgi:peptidyl-prolyl cis-trans isomerase B (cyclophilin B)
MSNIIKKLYFILFLLVFALALEGGNTTMSLTKKKLEAQLGSAVEIVTIKTTLGDIKVALFSEIVPSTVKNFLAYVDADFYNGAGFQPAVNGVLITELKNKKLKRPIKNEANIHANMEHGLKHKRGALAMARDPNNAHSATASFFINYFGDLPELDYKNNTPKGFGYCVFGTVIDGMDVVDEIVNTDNAKIHSITRAE